MYKTLAIILTINNVLMNLIFYSNPYLNTFFMQLSNIIIGFVLAFFGNSLYYNYSRKTLSNIKKIPQDELTFQGMLLKKGGNSWGGIGIALLLGIGIATVINALFKYVIFR